MRTSHAQVIVGGGVQAVLVLLVKDYGVKHIGAGDPHGVLGINITEHQTPAVFFRNLEGSFRSVIAGGGHKGNYRENVAIGAVLGIYGYGVGDTVDLQHVRTGITQDIAQVGNQHAVIVEEVLVSVNILPAGYGLVIDKVVALVIDPAPSGVGISASVFIGRKTSRIKLYAIGAGRSRQRLCRGIGELGGLGNQGHAESDEPLAFCHGTGGLAIMSPVQCGSVGKGGAVVNVIIIAYHTG